MIAQYPQVCPKCKKPLLHTDIVMKHIKYCKCDLDKLEDAHFEIDKKAFNNECWKELEHFRKTKIPRCPICKKNYVQISQYIWQQACRHNKNRRISIG